MRVLGTEHTGHQAWKDFYPLSHPTGPPALYFNILFLEHILPLVCVYCNAEQLQVDANVY